MTTQQATEASVRKSITVKASVEHAFQVFTEGFDTWWPRGHHIGTAPLKKAIIEGRVGGRCYSEQIDGTECPWGSVLAWEPHTRLVLEWGVNADWQYDPELKTEIEVRFIAQGERTTRVELEHRRLDRYGARRDEMRRVYDTEGDWGKLLESFARLAEQQ